MKKILLFLVMMAVSGAASAQFYIYIPYYDNNPFVFCTVGVPWDCWAPINPATGTFTVTNPYCYNPVSSALYAKVCPMAFPNGVNSASAMLPAALHRVTNTSA